MIEKKLILVVDDDADLLYFMNLILSMKGYAVQTLVDGTKMLESLADHRPDLIILDINLGNCMGTDLCAQMKGMERFSMIPVVLYSANKYDTDIHKSCNADAYMEKPFTNDHLLNTVRAFITPSAS